MPEKRKLYEQEAAALPNLVPALKKSTALNSEAIRKARQVKLADNPEMEKVVRRLIDYLKGTD